MKDGHVTRSYRPSTDEIAQLIRRAEGHPLGTDFLLNGALDAVAAMFQVHGFVVDAARDSLHGAQSAPDVLESLAAC